MLQATEFRKGHVVLWEEGLWYITDVKHITPGNWRAIIQVKFRNLQTGVSREQRFSSGDKLERAVIDSTDMEFLYADGENLVFMNPGNYEQMNVHRELLGDDLRWLKENVSCTVSSHEGRVIGVELPPSVDLKVVETEPALKGATITNVGKPAKLETGAVVKVPPFISEGEIIRIDTRSGEYLERANK